MYNPFFSTMMLPLESQEDVELQLMRLARGGHDGEAANASVEAAKTQLSGRSMETVIARHREYVAVKTARLTAS